MADGTLTSDMSGGIWNRYGFAYTERLHKAQVKLNIVYPSAFIMRDSESEAKARLSVMRPKGR